MTTNTLHRVEFFDLQLRFAAKAAELDGLSWPEAIGRYTNFYVRLGMGPSLDAGNPDWIACLDELHAAHDAAAAAHAIHVRRLHLPIGPPHDAVAGCFSYAHVGARRVRLHFHADDRSRDSPLGTAHQADRRADLTRLFATLKASDAADSEIVGGSWLYNLPAYRRLFPKRYVESLRPIAPPCQRMPLWGQFLNRDRSVRSQAAESFLRDVARANSMAALTSCFPFQVLTTTASSRCFYEHLGL